MSRVGGGSAFYGQLCVGQADHMAPGLERARLVLRSSRPHNLGDKVRGHKIANLMQDTDLGAGWSDFGFVYPCRVAGKIRLFQPFSSVPMGCL